VQSKILQVVRSGERTNTTGKPVSNVLLLSCSDSDYRLLRPHLEHLALPDHAVLHEAGEKLEFAYFPNRGLISLVVVMEDGKTAEAGQLLCSVPHIAMPRRVLCSKSQLHISPPAPSGRSVSCAIDERQRSAQEAVNG
jgi:hypothetical protein